MFIKTLLTKVEGPKKDILEFVESHKENPVINEILAFNKFFSIIEFIVLILANIIGVIECLFFVGKGWFDYFFITIGIIIVGNIVYPFLTRMRRLTFFYKAEKLILLDEIKLSLKQ